jgi:hypothetical protein
MSIIIAAIKPPMKLPMTAPITVPRITIHTASVNFAFSFPTSALPANQRTGATIIVPTTIWINSATRSVLNHLLGSTFVGVSL